LSFSTGEGETGWDLDRLEDLDSDDVSDRDGEIDADKLEVGVLDGDKLNDEVKE